MSDKKAVIFFVVIILAAAGMWWYAGNKALAPDLASQISDKQILAAKPRSDAMLSAIKASGSSDAAIDQDVSAIDKEMNLLNADSADISQGLGDEPVLQLN